MKKIYRNSFFLVCSAVLAAAMAFTAYAYIIIEKHSTGKTFGQANQLPHNKVGLLLGTSKFLASGNKNPYFFNRIAATVELFKAGKIDFVIVSGDNGTPYYDEPTAMQKELIKNGVDSSRIYLDYAGFRTFDSVVRAGEVFGQDSLTIISQKFHNERALYIASKFGIVAVGYNAADVPALFGLKTQLREILARANVLTDLLLGVKPKYLGEKIQIP